MEKDPRDEHNQPITDRAIKTWNCFLTVVLILLALIILAVVILGAK